MQGGHEPALTSAAKKEEKKYALTSLHGVEKEDITRLVLT